MLKSGATRWTMAWFAAFGAAASIGWISRGRMIDLYPYMEFKTTFENILPGPGRTNAMRFHVWRSHDPEFAAALSEAIRRKWFLLKNCREADRGYSSSGLEFEISFAVVAHNGGTVFRGVEIERSTRPIAEPTEHCIREMIESLVLDEPMDVSRAGIRFAFPLCFR